jgi:hypothetical protein
MLQIHFCPYCGARAAYSDRFCGTCGFCLMTVVTQEPATSYDYLFPYQQWVPSALCPARGQQTDMRGSDVNARPMSAEISKLLADLFEKRLKYDKT